MAEFYRQTGALAIHFVPFRGDAVTLSRNDAIEIELNRR
jgi:hypothetical protein